MKENENIYKSKRVDGGGALENFTLKDLKLPRWGRLPFTSFSSHYYHFVKGFLNSRSIDSYTYFSEIYKNIKWMTMNAYH